MFPSCSPWSLAIVELDEHAILNLEFPRLSTLPLPLQRREAPGIVGDGNALFDDAIAVIPSLRMQEHARLCQMAAEVPCDGHGGGWLMLNMEVLVNQLQVVGRSSSIGQVRDHTSER